MIATVCLNNLVHQGMHTSIISHATSRETLKILERGCLSITFAHMNIIHYYIDTELALEPQVVTQGCASTQRLYSDCANKKNNNKLTLFFFTSFYIHA